MRIELIKNVLLNEWRGLRSDKIVIALAIILTFCTAYAFRSGMKISHDQAREFEENESIARQKLDAQRQLLEQNMPPPPGPGNVKPSDPYAMSTLDHTVVLPPHPLSVVSVGQSDLYPHMSKVRAWSSDDKTFAQAESQNPVNLQIGRFDLSFVVVYLLPLLIIVLSYNLLSGEYEDGTLALVFSQPIRPLNYLLTKVAARTAFVSILVAVLLTGGLLICGVSLSSTETLARAIVWLAIVFLYGLFWFALAALVNAFRYSSATNALILTSGWLLFVVVLPSLIGTIATFVHPVPARGELIIAQRDAEPKVIRDGARVLSRFYQDHPELRPEASAGEVSEFRRQLLSIYLENLKTLDQVAGRYDTALDAQQKFVKILGCLSPSVVTYEALSDLAGTGTARYRDFRSQVNLFIKRERDFFFPKALANQKLTVADYASIPLFEYREEAGSDVLYRVAAGLAGLIAASAICFIVASWRISKFEI